MFGTGQERVGRPLRSGARQATSISVFSSMGDYDKAAEYFQKSLGMIDEIFEKEGVSKAMESTNRGGVLLGLGLIKERCVREGKERTAFHFLYKYENLSFLASLMLNNNRNVYY